MYSGRKKERLSIITKASILEWPEGVELGENAIIDHDTTHFYEINDTALLMLKKVNGRDSIERIGLQLVDTYGWPETQGLNDFLIFIQTLNQRYLIKITNPMT